MMMALLVIHNGIEHFEVHCGIRVILWRVFSYPVVRIKKSMRTTGNENTHHEITHSVVCIMTYFSNTEYEYTGILAACRIFAG